MGRYFEDLEKEQRGLRDRAVALLDWLTARRGCGVYNEMLKERAEAAWAVRNTRALRDVDVEVDFLISRLPGWETLREGIKARTGFDVQQHDGDFDHAFLRSLDKRCAGFRANSPLRSYYAMRMTLDRVQAIADRAALFARQCAAARYHQRLREGLRAAYQHEIGHPLGATGFLLWRLFVRPKKPVNPILEDAHYFGQLALDIRRKLDAYRAAQDESSKPSAPLETAADPV